MSRAAKVAAGGTRTTASCHHGTKEMAVAAGATTPKQLEVEHTIHRAELPL